MDIQTTLHPGADAPQRMVAEITDALSGLPWVRGVAVFGSLAEESADRFSDIDMLVSLDEVEATKWTSALSIRDAKPVLYYRPFSLMPQPAGRYWFENESAFNRLDISFYGIEEYQGYFADPCRFGKAITLREVYAVEYADLPPLRPACLRAKKVSERETAIGRALYFLVNGLKGHLRGKETLDDVAELEEELRNHLDTVKRDAVMSGGQIGELAYHLLDITDYLRANAIKLR